MATCSKEVSVPLNYKTEGKSYSEIYNEVHHLFGAKDDVYLIDNLVGKDDVENLNIIIENISLVFCENKGQINMIENCK